MSKNTASDIILLDLHDGAWENKRVEQTSKDEIPFYFTTYREQWKNRTFFVTVLIRNCIRLFMDIISEHVSRL